MKQTEDTLQQDIELCLMNIKRAKANKSYRHVKELEVACGQMQVTKWRMIV